LQTMMWNKVKMAVVLLCVFGVTGIGAGWLTRGRVGAETTPLAAQPPANKDLPDAIVPERRDNAKDEIRRIHAAMDMLAEKEHVQEAKLSEEMIEVKLRLVELQDELRIREREGQQEDEVSQSAFKDARRSIRRLEEMCRGIDRTLKPEDAKKHSEQFKQQLQKEREAFDEELSRYRENQIKRVQVLRPIRKEVYRVEETLRSIEVRQTRQREDFAAKRQALFARLQQLEEMSSRVEPADRLREVERKLDALRRDVNELRRAVERQGGEPRKKP